MGTELPMERLTAQDLMMVWPEDLGWSQDIGALAILDGSDLLDDEGRIAIEAAAPLPEGREG